MRSSRRSSNPYRLALPCSLILIGLGLRLLGLDLQPLWWDEGYSLYFATESPLRLLELTSRDIHPPLYYLLLQGWLSLVGIGAFQARLLSVLLGVLALPLIYQVARPLAGRHAAVVALLLLAFSPLHAYYSQEVRMYGLLALLALLAVAMWQRRAWWALGGALLAGLLAHYYFALLALALGLLVLRDLRQRRYSFRGPARALAVLVAGCLPWLLYSIPRLLAYVGDKLAIEGDVPMAPLPFLARHFTAWSMGHLPDAWGWVAWSALLLVALATTGIIQSAPRSHPGRDVVALWALPSLGVFLVGLQAPFVDARIERQLLFVLPFFLLLAAQGLTLLRRRSSLLFTPVLATILLFNLLALWGFYTTPRYAQEDYRPLLALVGAAQGPGDGWLAVYPWQVGYLRAYLPGDHPAPLLVDLSWHDDPAAMRQGLSTLWREHPRLWFPAYQVQGRLLEEELAASLAGTGVHSWDDWFGNSRLFLFGSAPDVPPLHPIGQFEGAGAVSAALGRPDAPSGTGIIPLFLQLEGEPAGLRASAQLVGDGTVWGEWDGVLLQGNNRLGIPVAHGTPPGDYQVRLSLYHEASGQPVDRFQDGVRALPEAPIAPVTITRPEQPLPPAALRRLASHPLEVAVGDTIRLLGASLADRVWQQGETIPITLFWQAVDDPGPDLRIFVQVLDAAGAVRAASDVPPVNGAFPTGLWRQGDLVRDPHEVMLPADLPAGEYRLVAGIYDPASGERLAIASEGGAVQVDTLLVAERARLTEEPALGVATDVRFGERARLARLETPEHLEEGSVARVTLVWESLATGGRPLRAFVQLYHGDDQLFSSDHPIDPPATAWLHGEWIVDEHLVGPLPSLPPGEYRLVAGLYDPATGARLLTAEGEQATIARWVVGEP